jgi:outer membrane protease
MGICKKWRCFFVTVFLLSALKGYGAAPFTGSVEANFGIMQETAQEIVLTAQNGRLLSHLNWQDQPTPYIEVIGKFEAFNFMLQGSFLSAIPMTDLNGIMEDRDWECDNNPTKLTTYSRHDTTIDRHYDYSLALGYIWKLWDFRVVPAAGLEYRTRKWTGWNGWQKNPADGSPHYYDGPEWKDGVISYEQSIWLPFISLEAAYTLMQTIEFSVVYNFTPWLYAEAKDIHFNKAHNAYKAGANTIYYDLLDQGGLGHKVKLAVRYFPESRKFWALVLNGGFAYFKTMPGNSFIKEEDAQLARLRQSGQAITTQWNCSLGFAIYVR